MKVIYKLFLCLFIAAALIFTACEDRTELTAPAPPSTGSVDFTHFVTLGNSITAGYQSGSLYQSAQVYSYGCQIAKLVNTSYVQPIFTDPGTTGRMEFGGFTSTGITIKYNTGTGLPVNTSYAAPFNNLGIPGAILYDIMDETDFAAKSVARANPLFSAVLRSTAFGKSIIKQALAQTPTLITLWIGNNDVLGYATSGGTKGTDPATGKLPTDVPTFTALYNGVAAQLKASGAKVVVANLPSIAGIPFFNTIPAALKSGSTVITLYGTTKTGVRALLPYQDLLLLTASSVLLTSAGQPTGLGLSPNNPIPDQYILDKDEVIIVNNAVTALNQVIAAAASTNGFALADMNELFSSFSVRDASMAFVGKYVDGINFSPAYVTGGLFSLDGVHPSSQGHTIIANKFIQTINAKWGSSIPTINVSTTPASLIIGKEAKISKYGIPYFEKGAFDNILF